MAAGPRNSDVTEASPLLADPASEVSSQTLAEDADDQGPIDPDKANQSVGTLRAVLIILSLWILIFLQAANMSGLTTTQSIIAADLDAFTQASWFTSSYLIAMSSIAPLAGRLSQLFSPRNCIFVSALVFAVGGLVTSRARSFAGFLAGRVVSGVGGAGVMTISIILVLELTGKRRRGVFIGLVNAGYTSGIALGAMIAGGLVEKTGWRALFWIQTPLASLAGLGLFLGIPKSFVSGPRVLIREPLSVRLAKVDYSGAVTLTSSIVLFLYGMASPKIQWIPILISTCLIIIFILNEIYVAQVPIIPISVLKSRGTLLTCAAQLGFMMARWTVLFYSPVYAMAIRGWSPASAGSVLIPTNIGLGLGGLIVGGLHIKRGGSFYLPCVITFILFAFTLYLVSHLSTPTSSTPLYIILLLCNGLITGAALNYTLSHLLFLTSQSDHFIVTSLIATFRGFAGSFGSAIGSGIFLRVLQSSLKTGFEERGMKGEEELVRKLLGSPALVRGLRGAEREVAVQGYVGAVKALFVAASGLAMVMVVVQAGTGWKAPAGVVEANGEETIEEQEEEERARLVD